MHFSSRKRTEAKRSEKQRQFGDGNNDVTARPMGWMCGGIRNLQCSKLDRMKPPSFQSEPRQSRYPEFLYQLAQKVVRG